MPSNAASTVWAKSPNETGEWLPLHQHLADTAQIAAGLLDRWAAPAIVEQLKRSTGHSEGVMRRLVCFLAGVHDIGKATPSFAVMNRSAADRMTAAGLHVPADVPDRRLAHHTVTGQHILSRWLVQHGASKDDAATLSVVVGGHHGKPPSASALTATMPSRRPHLYGDTDGAWNVVREELLAEASITWGITEELVPDLRLPQSAQVTITALVILADWIASNEELVPWQVGDAITRATAALDGLALPRPWRPVTVSGDTDTLFAARFNLPEGSTPRPVQTATVEQAWSMESPGLLVVEAAMGEGKTEAALAAAEILAHRFGAGGLHVALPTQATSDGMFERVLSWADHAPGGALGKAAIWLGHGKSSLNADYQERRAHKVDEDGEGQASVHPWLSGAKKSSLANVAVSTIDQLLFSALQLKHVSLRHLGLAGKVVVIDEVHAYDAFTSVFLERTLRWLGEYRVPTIMLSATLPPERRALLVAAYTGQEPDPQVAAATDYPLITSACPNVDVITPRASGRSCVVQVEVLGDDLIDLVDEVKKAIGEGGCALVVRNTVNRAREAAEELEVAFPGDVTLMHSRFLAKDRAAMDKDLLNRFGPPERASHRPDRHIVVATQVVEQSLDVDFDVLFTDVAPIDLMLQRAGRMHRHERRRPAGLGRARVLVTGVTTGLHETPTFPAGSEAVYGRWALLRSIAALLDVTTLDLPHDIAKLVREAYDHAEITPWPEAVEEAWDEWSAKQNTRELRARDFLLPAPDSRGRALNGWIDGSSGADETHQRAVVRDGEFNLEVMVLERDAGGDLVIPGTTTRVDTATVPSYGVAEGMAGCTLRLPVGLSRQPMEASLWNVTPPAWAEAPLVCHYPLLVLDEQGRGTVGNRIVRYDRLRGLEEQHA